MGALRVGFVGLGGIARERHVPGLRRIRDVRIAAVANRTLESAQRAAAEFDIPVVCDTWEDLVARDDLDAVFVATWPYMHHPVSLAALDAGKHVFCQARMAMDFQQAREMHRKAAASGRVAALCPVPYGLSVDNTVARLLREGYLGELRLVRVTSLSDACVDPAAPLSWRKDYLLSGLNALTVGMFIEVIHRWFGWSTLVSAQTQLFVPERRDAEGRSVAVLIPDQFVFTATIGDKLPVQYAISGAVRHSSDLIEIYGTKASLRYDVRADVLFGARAGKEFSPVEIRPEEAYDVKNWRVEEDFVRAIREGFDYHPNFEDGLRYMQVLEAVYESARQHRAIGLGDPCAAPNAKP
jgi:predicted dehydrogenase